MAIRVRPILHSLVSLICLNSAGCLYVPYCLPEVDRLSTVQAPWPSGDVHVFRVDGTKGSWQRTALMIGDGPAGGCDETHELTRLQASDAKKTAEQWSIGLERGWLCVGLVNRVASSTTHTVALRFYRRGFETITVKPGDEQKDLAWKAAPDLTGQEKAVDDLIDNRQRVNLLLGYNTHTSAAPGTHSPAHREALRFCADEYDRIAFRVAARQPDSDAMKKRLADKAQGLRALADGKQVISP